MPSPNNKYHLNRLGSTWAQEMVWLLSNNLNFKGAEKMQVMRTPLLELSALFAKDQIKWLKEMGNSVDYVDHLISPRFIKSHLPFEILPNAINTIKPRIIYTSRNPKDLCVSYYFYLKLAHQLTGTFDEFCEIFLTDHAPMGSFWSHTLTFWNKRNDSNVYFLKYEDMINDLPTVIRDCAKFLGVTDVLNDEANIKTLCDHLQFQKMQHNPAVNLEPIVENNTIKFIRKGQIGDWRNYMSDELSERFDQWIKVNSEGTGLIFDYE